MTASVAGERRNPAGGFWVRPYILLGVTLSGEFAVAIDCSGVEFVA